MNGRRAKKLRRETYNSAAYGLHDYRVRQHHQLHTGKIIADPIRQRYKKRKRDARKTRQ